MQNKLEKIAKLGYRVTSTREFLGLSEEEMALIELKLSLVEKLKRTRREKKLPNSSLRG